MSLSDKLRKATIDKIVTLINKSADEAHFKIELKDQYDIKYSPDMNEEIKSHFNEDEIRIDNNGTVTIEMDN